MGSQSMELCSLLLLCLWTAETITALLVQHSEMGRVRAEAQPREMSPVVKTDWAPIAFREVSSISWNGKKKTTLF